MGTDYKDGDTILILMQKQFADLVLDAWMEEGWECELRVHRSKKTKGCVVIETRSLMWANRILKGCRFEKVNIRKSN